MQGSWDQLTGIFPAGCVPQDWFHQTFENLVTSEKVKRKGGVDNVDSADIVW